MRRQVLVVAGLLLSVITAGCQPSPPTVVYIVVSPTPDEPDILGSANSPVAPIPTTAPTMASTSAPIATFTPAATAPPDLFPTPLVAQVQVAEQVYENGRMFWIQPVSQIWVMIVDGEGRGQWLRFQDTFVEGVDPESDESITPPEGMLQPVRGFGKLWRENPDLREQLGWAITPEFGYISQYEYHPDGEVKDGAFELGFGYHLLFSLNGEAFRFDEETSTWRLNS